MSDVTLSFSPELYSYYQNISLREPKVLKALREQTRKLSTAQMQISPEQGQFMRLLIELIGARKTLDIGVYTGYSALSAALSLPIDGKVIACDINTEWTRFARQYWEKAGMSQKIDLRLAPAAETLQFLVDNGEAGTFDFAFIDADKANYSLYYEYSFALVRSGGLIAVDNVLWSGKVANSSINDPDTVAIRSLNAKILNDERVWPSMLPIGDGLTLARKK